ncbi:MAG: cobalamin biosynthesis protein [Actinomycetota bacterium]|nr:cobalamin biosynthesis protein [Actinomycetota bacterium]
MSRPSTPLATGLLAGVVLDAVVPDPRRWHPVAGFGHAATAVERRLWADSRVRGAAYAAVCTLPVTAVGSALARSAGRRPARLFLLTAAATWAVLGATSLRREALAMADALEQGDLEAARTQLPSLCGRDPAALDEKGLARATVESVAENTSDAVVAPLFWGAVAGVPGLVAYRAVNTLDAMVGHRSPRYAHFGTACGRLDDAANWLPARVTGALTVLTASATGGSTPGAARTWWRDGAAHPSPNAGRCEAAFAGALGVRLGGRNVYTGRVEHRPHLGDGPPPEASDVRRAVRLSRAVTVSAALAAGAAAWLRPYRRVP